LSFFLWASTAYGLGVFQAGFVLGIFQPYTYYAAGLGGFSVGWDQPMTILYGVCSQIVAFAVIAFAAVTCLYYQTGLERKTLLGIFLVSMLGVCLQLKWVNMSIDALWFVNGLPILAMFGWLARSLCLHFEAVNRAIISKLMQVVGVLIMVIFLWFVQDPRNPSLYGLQSFRIYPSLLLRYLVDLPRTPWPTGLEIQHDDIELITQNSKSGEPVAIIAGHDWSYLLAARRPPKIQWLPSTTMFYFPKLFEPSLRNVELIFVAGDISAMKDDFSKSVYNLLQEQYVLAGSGTHLRMYAKY
jgi:hypothetical protein